MEESYLCSNECKEVERILDQVISSETHSTL